jgi:hypothetical protein
MDNSVKFEIEFYQEPTMLFWRWRIFEYKQCILTGSGRFESREAAIDGARNMLFEVLKLLDIEDEAD